MATEGPGAALLCATNGEYAFGKDGRADLTRPWAVGLANSNLFKNPSKTFLDEDASLERFLAKRAQVGFRTLPVVWGPRHLEIIFIESGVSKFILVPSGESKCLKTLYF